MSDVSLMHKPTDDPAERLPEVSPSGTKQNIMLEVATPILPKLVDT